MLTIPTNKLKLLKHTEIKGLYSLPCLEEQDRDIYFSLNNQEMKLLLKFHTLSSKFLFILQLGFFRAGKRFYSLKELDSAEEEKTYVCNRYFPREPLGKFSLNLSKPTRLAHQSIILKLFDYRKYSGDVVKLIEKEAHRLAGIHSRPSYIVRELLRFLERERIIIPSYPNLQDLVGKVLQGEISRLEIMTDKKISQEEKAAIDKLLDKREDFLYELTLLKRDPKNFSLKEIKETILKRDSLNRIYPYAKDLALSLHISDQNLIYYSNLVSYYSIYKIRRMAPLTRRLLILCFIYIRYQMINDQLVKAFLYRVDKFVSEGKEAAKEEIYRRKINSSRKLEKIGNVLKLFVNEKENPDNIHFKEVRERAFSIIEKEELTILSSSLIKEHVDEKALEWKQLDKMSYRIKIHLRPLLLSINFCYHSSCDQLSQAISALGDKISGGSTLNAEKISDGLFTKSSRKYILSEGKTVPSRYEFQLYRTLARNILSGNSFVTDSLSYRSFDQDLVGDEIWKDKDKIIDSLGLPKLKENIKDLLDAMEQELDELYVTVNERIASGENSYIKFSGKNNERWTIPYIKGDESDKIDLFENMPKVRLNTLLNLVNSNCFFTNSFTHALGRYVKKSHSIREILATIAACGTNMGLAKMARNSNISHDRIHQTYRNFIRPETLKQACDTIVDGIKNLSFFSDWNIDAEKIYSSSDGQKFGSSKDTCNARHSPKYFGLEKGVVSYTLNANHLPLNAKIMGANEHESHYVLDILLDNSTEIRPGVHTTDTHGTNRVNFALLYLFDYEFAPRYKNFPKEAKDLYCFGDPNKYTGLLLPKGKTDRELIESEYDNVLRIVVSLAIKTTSQSTIVRKLSSYSMANKTRKALVELDKIRKSIHILRYADRPIYRQFIQKALNRGESYHSLKRSIFNDNLGKFRVSSEHEQHIWSECTRLLALCVIYYNSFILSQFASRQSNLDGKMESLKEYSPISWKHIDLCGRFYFGDKADGNEIENILMAIEKLDFTPFRKTKCRTG